MSDTSYAPPSRNPTNDGTLRGVLKVFFQKSVQGQLDDMLPAQVVAYDRTKNVADIQPLIQIVTTSGEIITRAQIASVPVFRFGAGNMVLSYDLNPGDRGWLKANDSDISIFKQSFGQSIPNTARMHCFSDALFIPDPMTGVTIASEDANNAVLQTLDGTVRLALWPTQLKVTAPNMGVGDTPGYTPNPNAVLDVQSTTRAFKLPRMSHAQRDAIASPVGGMAVYCDDPPAGPSFYVDGVGWS